MFLSILVLILYATVVGAQMIGPTPAMDKYYSEYDTCGRGNFSDFRLQWLEHTPTMCLMWSNWPSTYIKAKEYCKRRGTRLGVFNTWDKMRILQRRNGLIYIGLDDLKTEGRFIWHNGEQLKSPNINVFFHKNEPSNSKGIEDCVVLKGSYLSDVPCTMIFLFVCELELGS
ncbi:hemolymph lipopolysaccharide-binding protein-like [Biomphalaria glabrata]|uniref:Hemolymph lipopolysaccharide-binding protein-like n=1 Tax=Biomphalaria glabrata TaxID=6526 RepID=A0A9W3AAR1_BIOGL|nr:hemolymph lipopolysaccharide-binding protein-like [Biomphalaria glabrata]